VHSRKSRPPRRSRRSRASLAQGPQPAGADRIRRRRQLADLGGEEKGLFAENGIAVKLSFTPNSVEQIPQPDERD